MGIESRVFDPIPGGSVFPALEPSPHSASRGPIPLVRFYPVCSCPEGGQMIKSFFLLFWGCKNGLEMGWPAQRLKNQRKMNKNSNPTTLEQSRPNLQSLSIFGGFEGNHFPEERCHILLPSSEKVAFFVYFLEKYKQLSAFPMKPKFQQRML